MMCCTCGKKHLKDKKKAQKKPAKIAQKTELDARETRIDQMIRTHPIFENQSFYRFISAVFRIT